ncbi:MAG: GyrI-like domain-containing protein [Planktotalea sp.]|uniref:GyrI-like domain-containing protein n=1 Tax=Planktotalea sp. TaxID=2029877 RepID=UPI003C70F0F3
MSKLTLGKDYVVAPLEGLWWADDMSAYTEGRRDEWLWTLMIMQPDWITADMFAQALEKAVEKKGPQPPSLRFESFAEGLSVQILHIGPYSDEGPTLARLHNEYMPEHGLTWNGKHHEIYLSDPRRAAPEKLKTVLRQPVKRA